jgi:predicted RecB family nuclease
MKEITPRVVTQAMSCLHFWYLECHGNPQRRRALPPRIGGVEEPAEASRRRLVEWLPDLAEPSWDGLNVAAAFGKTRELMTAGRSWIYRGVLKREGMWGQPDLLRRVEGRSALGAYSYAPLKLKDRPGPATKRDLFELRIHALLLEPILAKRPRRGWIYLGPGQMTEVDLTKPSPEFDTLLSDLERIRRGEIVTEGCRVRDCAACPWSGHCNALWRDAHHVGLLPGVRPGLVPVLRDAGYLTWKAIARSNPGRLASAAGLPPSKALDLWLHARAWERGRPVSRRAASFPKDRPVQFVSAEFEGRYGFLLGAVRSFEGERRCKQFLARSASAADEQAIWHAFLDYLARDPRARILVWAASDLERLRTLWERHGGNRKGWALLRKRAASLQEFVRAHVALPVSTYRFKEVAAALTSRKASWSDLPLGEAYARWRERGEGEALRQVLAAHRERLAAMKSIYFSLQVLQELGDGIAA